MQMFGYVCSNQSEETRCCLNQSEADFILGVRAFSRAFLCLALLPVFCLNLIGSFGYLHCLFWWQSSETYSNQFVAGFYCAYQGFFILIYYVQRSGRSWGSKHSSKRSTSGMDGDRKRSFLPWKGEFPSKKDQLKITKKRNVLLGTPGDLMVSALGPSSNYDWCRCIVFLGKTLDFRNASVSRSVLGACLLQTWVFSSACRLDVITFQTR